ncbi:neural-cadherin [Caerostris extrusa]|uniref:Neural-cadherin n=1 Tax=Caerostris extrusa TaxID=172846 RepID=A0AAV4QBC6_CAEEX|nr:neural-cadherin [Caerostris extrusa]
MREQDVALNNGIQQLASEATVYIVLEDVNDEIPLFIEREQETVLEGMPPNTKVTQVQASDKDGTYPNNKITGLDKNALCFVKHTKEKFHNFAINENVTARSSHQKLYQKHPQSSNQTSPEEISHPNVSPLFIPSTRTSSDRHKFASFRTAPNKSWDYKFSQRVIYSMSTEYRIPSHRRKDTCLERLRVQTCRFGLIRRQMRPLN